ncbi:MAG: hypothetical protein Q7K44_00220, partial [Candidatus Liptonbacteria bacterium]|nr:hypothetical protein [Candidatus Liptonbacteria bacterium]
MNLFYQKIRQKESHLLSRGGELGLGWRRAELRSDELLRGFGRQHRELQPVSIERLLFRVAVPVDVVESVLGDDVAAFLCYEVDAGRLHVGLHGGHAADDARAGDEVPERVRLVENDEELTILQLVGDLQEVRRCEIAPAEFLAVPVVPAAVVNEVATATLSTPDAEQGTGRAKLVPEQSLGQSRLRRHHVSLLWVVGCWILATQQLRKTKFLSYYVARKLTKNDKELISIYCIKYSISKPFCQAISKQSKKPLFGAILEGSEWIKKFSSPKIKIWFEPMFFSGFFCGFQRCGSAAFPNFRGGTSSPPQAAKCVRTNSRILHQKGKIKRFWFASLRSATNLYSILGVKTNSQFRILGEENFL